MTKSERKVAGGNDLSLHVDEHGDRDGDAILFIHGLSNTRLAWEKQLSSHLCEKHHLIALDLRGHGASEKPDRKTAYTDPSNWATDIHNVIDAFQLDSVTLVGWSYGGVVIANYLDYYGSNRVAAINLVGALTAIETVEDMEVSDVIADKSSNNALRREEGIKKSVRKYAYHGVSQRDFYFFTGMIMDCPSYVYEYCLAREEDHGKLLQSVNSPILVSHGRQDEVVPDVPFGDASKRSASMTHSLYDKAGHIPFWEHPERFNDELDDLAESAAQG